MDAIQLAEAKAEIYKASTGIRLYMNRLRDALNDLEATLATVVEEEQSRPVKLTLWVDGGSRGDRCQGYGSFAIFEEGKSVPISQASKIFGKDMPNNEAQYYALLWGLEQFDPPAVSLTIKTDSILLEGQLREERPRIVITDNLRPHWEQTRGRLQEFASWRISKVLKAEVEAVLEH